MYTATLFFGIVLHCHSLYTAFGIVVDNKLDRVDDSHYACGDAVQIIANGMLEKAYAIECLVLGITDCIDKVADRSRGIATTAHTRDSRHTRIIPTGNKAFLYQLQQLALAHHGIGRG